MPTISNPTIYGLHIDDNANALDDRMQFTELGEGKIEASLGRVRVFDSAKLGFKFEQWIEEDEDFSQNQQISCVRMRSGFAATNAGMNLN